MRAAIRVVASRMSQLAIPLTLTILSPYHVTEIKSSSVKVYLPCPKVSSFTFRVALGQSPGSCDRLHVHDMSLVNKVDGFTCQPGRLYKDAMPRGIGE